MFVVPIIIVKAYKHYLHSHYKEERFDILFVLNMLQYYYTDLKNCNRTFRSRHYPDEHRLFFTAGKSPTGGAQTGALRFTIDIFVYKWLPLIILNYIILYYNHWFKMVVIDYIGEIILVEINILKYSEFY